MKFRDKRGVEYTFDPKLHCGARRWGRFCIVGPGHNGSHWDGDETWVEMPNRFNSPAIAELERQQAEAWKLK